jgi:LicD family
VRPACCTEHLMELVGFTSDLLARHGIVHWLDYGSLLGAAREQELIPWDADADFGILQRESPTVLALAGEVTAAGHRLDASLQGVIRILYSDANASHVDLFLWEVRDGLLLPLEDTDYAWPGMASRLAFPERFITPLGEVSLHGRPFPAPRPVHEFLRDHRYGPGYATPARPIRSIRLYPSFDIEETTPEVERLITRIAAGDERLAQLRSDARWSHLRAVELWQKAGLPIFPNARRVGAVLAKGSGERPTATIESLATSVALLEQAIDELEHRSAGLGIRRAARRVRRIAELVVARLRRRPHRAGFPFGVETAEHSG